jgi:hypothetical protein
VNLETSVKLRPFIASVELAGKRNSNGTLNPGCWHEACDSISDWPESVELFGVTYLLEKVTTGKDGYESGCYC